MWHWGVALSVCFTRKYHVVYRERNTIAGEGSPCYSDDLKVSVSLSHTCPPGFDISESAKSCVCEQRLLQYSGTHQCNITKGITRDSSRQFWVGYDNQSHELILHPNCPFDYCVDDTVVFFLSNADQKGVV